MFPCLRLRTSDIVYLHASIVAAAIGITFIILYSWSIYCYHEVIPDCNSVVLSLSKICIEWLIIIMCRI